MKRNAVETILGAVVIFGALLFLTFSYKTGNVSTPSGYHITADFENIGGLKVGDEVQISGVKVGQVAGIMLDPKAYLARVTLDVDSSLKLTPDTAATISSTSLLGGKYLSLLPGNEDGIMKEGDRIQTTQSPQSLEDLLGKFIFSMSNKKDSDKSGSDSKEPASP